MSPISSILFLVVALALLITVGVYSIKGAMAVAALQNATNVGSAHGYLTGSAVASILGAGLIITVIILFFVFTEGMGEMAFPMVFTILLLITLGLVFLSGVLSAIAATRLAFGSATNTEVKNTAYLDAIISSVIGIVGFVGIMAFLIIMKVRAHKAEEKATSGTPGDPISSLTKGLGVNPSQIKQFEKIAASGAIIP